MVCSGEFMTKEVDNAWDYLDVLAKNAQSWDTSDLTERPKQVS